MIQETYEHEWVMKKRGSERVFKKIKKKSRISYFLD